MNTIVEVENLVKKYGDLTAVDGVSFAIQEGEIFGLLGPNGAGKTTLISVLTCLFPPTEGTVTIAGYDVVQDAAQVKEIIGVVPQDLALYPTISGRDNLIFFGQIYGLRGRELAQRIDQVLDIVGLADRAGDAVETYSGGMKRRLNLAAGLLHRPRVLFLDEPTVGVDPQARNYIFENVEALNREGITTSTPPTTWRRRSACVTEWPSLTRGASSPWTRPRASSPCWAAASSTWACGLPPQSCWTRCGPCRGSRKSPPSCPLHRSQRREQQRSPSWWGC